MHLINNFTYELNVMSLYIMCVKTHTMQTVFPCGRWGQNTKAKQNMKMSPSCVIHLELVIPESCRYGGIPQRDMFMGGIAVQGIMRVWLDCMLFYTVNVFFAAR